jgi:zinc transporter ZupT
MKLHFDDDHHEGEPSPQLLGVKLGVLFSILFISLFSVFFPFLLQLIAKPLSKYLKCCGDNLMFKLLKVLEIAQGFAGGVLLANGLLHMLPESHEIISHVLESSAPEWWATFPWAMLGCGVTIFILFVADAVLTKIVCTEADLFHKRRFCSPLLMEIVLWLSLSAHSLFNGLALGAEQDEKIAGIIVAIYFHHVFEAFAFGVILHKRFRQSPHNTVCSLLVLLMFNLTYSLGIPVGISIGIGLSFLESLAFKIFQGIVMSITAGAFIYVSCFEILMNHKHFEDPIPTPTLDVQEPISPDFEEKEEKIHKEHQQRLSKQERIVLVVRTGLFALGFAGMSALAIAG